MAATAALFLCGGRASAQRTMNNQPCVTISYTHGFSGHGDSGVDVSFGKYRMYSLWNAGAAASLLSCSLGDAGDMRYSQTIAYGEWLWRLWCTRNRLFSIYAGAGAFLGCEEYDPFGQLPDYIDTGLGKAAFLYGAHAKAQVEIFVIRKMAVVLTGTLPVNFTSPTARTNANIQTGIRMNF